MHGDDNAAVSPSTADPPRGVRGPDSDTPHRVLHRREERDPGPLQLMLSGLHAICSVCPQQRV